MSSEKSFLRSFSLFLFCAGIIVVFPGTHVEAGKNYQVFDVRRNLAMNAKDAVTRDYYVNAGTQDGLKAGMILSVYRRDPIFDTHDDVRDDLYAPVGQIKLIHVQRTLSVARLVAISKNTTSPIVDFRSVMIGDRIDLKSASMGTSGFEEQGNDDQGSAGAPEEGAASAAVEASPSPTGTESPSPKASKPHALVSKNVTPTPSPESSNSRDKKPIPNKNPDKKKVPDDGSLYDEENKPSLNTQ
jgi:hypothetical protein